MTPKQYYRRFVSFYGIIWGALFSAPVVAAFFPPVLSAALFPPLGPGQFVIVAKLVVLIFGVAGTMIVYFAKDFSPLSAKGSRWGVLLGATVFSLVMFCVYGALWFRFVRIIDLGEGNDPDVISVGYERSAYANQNFPRETDWEMFKARLRTEEQINTLFTPTSVAASRAALFLAYALFWLAAVIMSSLPVLFTLRDEEDRKKARAVADKLLSASAPRD
ncbi:MAG TPA: hypothetical protein VIY49_26445 [Bryobacteraceae bacterium]